MKRIGMWAIASLTTITTLIAADSPTNGPAVVAPATKGDTTYFYWQVADFGDNRLGSPSKATQVDKVAVISDKNTATVTPSPVPGAKGYLILRSMQVTAPKPKVVVNKKGDATLYYWLVVRQGWYFTAPSEPAIAVGCDGANPDNTIAWDPPPGGPYEYDLLRTTTPHLPLGRAVVSAANRYATTSFHDTYPILGLTRLFAEGNFGTPPFGEGPYLLGRTSGQPIVDQGQPLQSVTLLGGNKEGRDERTIVVDDPPEEASRSGIMRRAFTIDSIHRQPTDRYTFGNQTALHIEQETMSGGLNDYYKTGWYGASAKAKTFYTGIMSDQFCYTHAQHVARFSRIMGYACGDKALEVAVIDAHAGNRDGGDEGSEFFSYQVHRYLEIAAFTLAEDAPRGSTALPVTQEQPQVTLGTGRILLNLSQTRKEGFVARIDNDILVRPGAAVAERVCLLTGHQTDWKPDMEGGYISLDTDTISDQYRTWYLVQKVVSPTQMHILAITYYAPSIYTGYAQNVVEYGLEYRGDDKTSAKPPGWKDVSVRKDGKILEPYLFAPSTELDDPCWTGKDGRSLKVLPLSTNWKAGDKLQIAPGPQATVGVGNILFCGELLPQDQLKGLMLINDTNRMGNDAGVWILGKGWRWGFRTDLAPSGDSCGFYVGGEKARPDEGCVSMPADTTGVTFRKVPLTISGNSKEKRVEFTAGWTEETKGDAILSVSSDAVRLHGNTVLCGNANTRGRVTLRGDGKATAFPVAFPRAYEATPVVTFSTSDFAASRLGRTEATGFVVEFAAPPPAGREITVSWIAQL